MDTAENLYEKILDDYTETEGEVAPEVEAFLNSFEGLADEKRNNILKTLEAKNIDNIRKLETELLKFGPDLTKDLKEKKVEKKAKEGTIAADNVGGLIEKYKDYKAVKLLMQLNAEQQVKALKKAGVSHAKQFNPADEFQMKRLQNAVATVFSGISESAGSKSREVSSGLGRSR